MLGATRTTTVTPVPPRGRSRVAAGLLTTVLALSGGALTTAAPAQAAVADDLTSYVNPFIGTQDDGNTFPGASVPFGMVQISPDTGHNTGYDYGQSAVRGFSLTHLSGVGCSIAGMVPILPTTGDISSTNNQSYAQQIVTQDGTKLESAAPGYYSVRLASSAGAITAELSATTHTGVQRYTFPQTDKANVLINPGQALTSVPASAVTIVDDHTVRTSTTIRGFCQDTQPFTVNTTTTFNRPFTSSATWNGDSVAWGSTTASASGRTGAVLRFDTTTDTVVEAQTSLSYVDPDGADRNLAAEASSFDAAREAAKETWQKRLETVKVTTSDESRLRPFYSALYRSFLAPNVGSDVDGRYRGWGTSQQIQHADGFTYYQNFSLWDTYRTQQQALALLAPRESADMAYSLVRQAIDGGSLPKWSYGPVETNIMTGDPGAVFIVSAWSQGLLHGHEAEAYEVITQSADKLPDPGTPYNGRSGIEQYVADGAIPYVAWQTGNPGDFDIQRAGSATLEYALADAGISTMAASLAASTTDPALKARYQADAERYAARGQSYRNIWDPSTGQFRSRTVDGTFVDESDPAWTPGFQEGTAVQYEWLAQQDMPGLIELMGGKDAAAARLDDFFSYERVRTDPAGAAHNDWVNQTYSYYGETKYNPNNETDLHAPFAYLWAGQPWKTTDVLRAALTLFTDGPTGVTGNDDLGEMSSWAVMSSIGLYPLVPGSDVWGLSTPMFDSVTLSLDPTFYPQSNGSLTLNAPGVSDSRHYTQSLKVDGATHDRGYLTGAQLTSARTLDYTVGSTPSTWATADDSAPGTLAPSGPVAETTDRVWASAPGAVPVPAGETREATVKILTRASGVSQGTVTVTATDPVTASIANEWSTTSAAGGSAAQTTPTLSLSVAAGTPPGTYPVTVDVAREGGGTVTRTIDVVVPQATWLQSSFNHTAIGDALAKNANMDGMGYYYNRALMADAGLLAGKSGTVQGTSLTYIMGGASAGPDNLMAQGQTTDVAVQLGRARQISVVGAAANGSVKTEITLTFASGRSSTASVALTDWCSVKPNPDNVTVGSRTERANGKRETDMIGCGFFASPTIDIPAGESLSSITWPNDSHLHVFAIASDVAPTTVTATTPARISGTPAPGKTLTATDPVWATPNTVTAGYQWSVDGHNITGAIGRTYAPTAEDAGRDIAVTITGTATGGFLPGSSTSESVRVASVNGPIVPLTAPKITGTAQIGQTLSIDPGTYSVDQVSISYQWLSDASPIPGATGQTLTLGQSSLGAKITARVTVTRAGYDPLVVVTAATSPVTAAGDGNGAGGGTTVGSGAGGTAQGGGDALAMTGSPGSTWLLALIGLAIVAAGAITVSRRRGRRTR